MSLRDLSLVCCLQDNPADYSFFFDTSRRRTCYIAPERFVDDSSLANTRPILTEAMDIFSLGSVSCLCSVSWQTHISHCSQKDKLSYTHHCTYTQFCDISLIGLCILKF